MSGDGRFRGRGMGGVVGVMRGVRHADSGGGQERRAIMSFRSSEETNERREDGRGEGREGRVKVDSSWAVEESSFSSWTSRSWVITRSWRWGWGMGFNTVLFQREEGERNERRRGLGELDLLSSSLTFPPSAQLISFSLAASRREVSSLCLSTQQP